MSQNTATASHPDNLIDPRRPVLPEAGQRLSWGRLFGDSLPLAVTMAALDYTGPVVLVTTDMPQLDQLQTQLRFFGGEGLEVLTFPDWETLPYDAFSPHQDIISQRIETLYRLPGFTHGVLILPVATLMQRVAPMNYIQGQGLSVRVGEQLDIDGMRLRFEQAGYTCVPQVYEHGEFAVRGSLLDVYPMGSELPYRLDLFDDEIESIRTFDPESQRSIEKVPAIHLLPAREFPFDQEAISRFRKTWRATFEGDPQRSNVYRDISQGITPSGIEYYLPLFFEQTASLLDYLPGNSLFLQMPGCREAAEHFWQELNDRFEQYRHDIERPILPPTRLYLSDDELSHSLEDHTRVEIMRFEQTDAAAVNFATQGLPDVSLKPRAPQPAEQLLQFIDQHPGRILITAESAGRRENLIDMLRDSQVRPKPVDGWQPFLDGDDTLNIAVAPLESGLRLMDGSIAVLTETQLLGRRASQVQKRKPVRDPETIIRDLTDLAVGAPVVHEDHGVGRYLGLQKLTAGGFENEFLTLEYAGGDKLYVPVNSLHLISRYTGTSPEAAPLHKLGTDQWARAKRKAAERAHDVAAELLEIYARRAARQGHSFDIHTDDYRQFAAAFPFEETPDQETAIEAVLADMAAPQPMDRVVCGDVGFGKTEVAMRAAFVAATSGRQVVMLVPTTLLAQQHYQNFRDRMADWPVRIEVLSRFRSGKQQDATLQALADGKIDIVIGTHKLLQQNVKFKQLGLVIVDEEHRFGVRQKERLKALRAEVDLLTLTATPIPRTLNMSLSGLRDLSIIATPPAQRLAIKTFVGEWNNQTIREACLREIKRGGQVYFLHNEVESIEKIARELAELIPEATIAIGHGQMRERELEQVMLDFYHRRFNLLVCTTIIESGIDVPTANTIIINRADKLGLAQLHQLRGRVGRSHHRAYAYMISPPQRTMTADAVKRLEAIASLEELGSGFSLSTHDLEIRGAGELLGDEQSGQIQEIGFTLYTELLERAVESLKAGREPDLERPLDHGAEIDLRIPALIPDDYLPDVHGRLILYKRISNCKDENALRDLQVEMIDRFGLLPQPVKNLFEITRLKLKALPLGIRKIDAGESSGRLEFNEQPHVDAARIVQLIQRAPDQYRLDGVEKLRFFVDMPDAEERLRTVTSLLNEITPEAA